MGLSAENELKEHGKRESSGHGHRYHLGAWKIEKTRVGVKYVQEGQYGVFHINHKYP